jgi:hypothetical protein
MMERRGEKECNLYIIPAEMRNNNCPRLQNH